MAGADDKAMRSGQACGAVDSGRVIAFTKTRLPQVQALGERIGSGGDILARIDPSHSAEAGNEIRMFDVQSPEGEIGE